MKATKDKAKTLTTSGKLLERSFRRENQRSLVMQGLVMNS